MPETLETHPSEAPRRAVVLLSGGLDSATVLAMVRQQNFAAYALSFAYGQRQTVELEAAARLAKIAGAAEHRVVRIDLGAFGGSALTDHALEVPKGQATSGAGSVPITYVPARNTVFLSYALAWAETLGAWDLFIGANAVDYSGYPDCRPAFIEAFERVANLGTRAADGAGRYRVHAPLMQMSKAQIIAAGTALGVDYAETHSCYDPAGGRACGRCEACVLRRQGFAQAQLADPTRYAIA